MKTTTKIECPTNIKALDFMASRLLNFKRIGYEELSELTARRFNLKTAEGLVNMLVKEGAVELRGEAVSVLKEDILKQFCLNSSCHEEKQGTGLQRKTRVNREYWR